MLLIAVGIFTAVVAAYQYYDYNITRRRTWEKSAQSLSTRHLFTRAIKNLRSTAKAVLCVKHHDRAP